ncbi:peptidoglycan-binding domain-containing protein [Nocardioides sp. Leaf307]|uniref:peptidoglycan-binding domain-containing protein n=1 Tax=Nocardioides sp. Leaf307 TaxID=1736331 RepID=UPI000ADF0195|nr:peptidoglycan-binding domain-containing protein [Nocardioides sp. Leaf307]
MDEPDLSAGSSGEWVTYLQQLLQQAGYLATEPDGDFGPATEGAVRDFQAAQGLDADGAVGPLTWAALTGSAAPETPTDPDTPTDPEPDPGPDLGGETDDVPVSLQEAGAPASLSEWTDEQKEAFFEGTVTSQVTAEAEPEPVEVLAMSDAGSSDGGVVA